MASGFDTSHGCATLFATNNATRGQLTFCCPSATTEVEKMICPFFLSSLLFYFSDLVFTDSLHTFRTGRSWQFPFNVRDVRNNIESKMNWLGGR